MKRQVILTNIGLPIQLKTVFLSVLQMLFVFSMVSVAQARTADEWYALGFELSIEGNREKAVRSYQQALRLKKNWPQAHHNLALLFYHLKDGVKAVHHLRLAKKLYLKYSSPESKRNLKIIQKNLNKTYSEFDLNPEDFEELDTLHPVSPSSTWTVMGHGFAIDGYVFTLAKGLADVDQVRVRLGDQPPMFARIVKRYIVYDLALLKLETQQPGFRFGNSSIHHVGDLLESPVGGADSSSWMKGSISGLNAIMNDKNIFELKFPSLPIPGSPLVNENGQVVGIILSTKKIVKNFQAAGFPPEGSIALKSSYLSRIFSVFKNSLTGPKKKGLGRGGDAIASPSIPATMNRNSALVIVEGKLRTGDGP
jgi:S1-C subfamily serine protease